MKILLIGRNGEEEVDIMDIESICLVNKVVTTHTHQIPHITTISFPTVTGDGATLGGEMPKNPTHAVTVLTELGEFDRYEGFNGSEQECNDYVENSKWNNLEVIKLISGESTTDDPRVVSKIDLAAINQSKKHTGFKQNTHHCPQCGVSQDHDNWCYSCSELDEG